MQKFSLLGLVALLLCTSTLAAPAAWQLWRSKTNGTTVCAQVSPGEAWEWVDGPYRDPRCTMRGKPGR